MDSAPSSSSSLPSSPSSDDLERLRAELQAHKAELDAARLDLLAREHQLDEVEHLSGIGSWTWDLRAGRVAWTRNLFLLHGVAPHSVTPSVELFLNRVHPDDRDAVREHMRMTLEHGAPYNFQTRILHADGATRVLQVRGALSLGEDGEPARLIGTVQDITEQREVEALLRASLKDKEVLIQEIHHRVKNNLQVISSLLGVQAARIDDRAARALLEQMQGRVRAIGALHEQLYQVDRITVIKAAQYLPELIALVRQSMGAAPTQRIFVEAGELELRLDQAVPCALILNELVSNAIKHAGHQATIRVSLTREADMISLSVQDDGPGYPSALDLAIPSSMGLHLVRTLSRQLGAQPLYTSQPGARCTIRFPSPQGA